MPHPVGMGEGAVIWRGGGGDDKIRDAPSHSAPFLLKKCQEAEGDREWPKGSYLFLAKLSTRKDLYIMNIAPV